MSLALDSLVTDLIFQSGKDLAPEALIDAFGGEEELQRFQALDPDMQDPRLEMELSPSMPFRRRGERRLMLIDDSVAPMRQNPRTDDTVPIDLRPARERLVQVCKALPIRAGRLFALGSWGDAVWVVRSFRDLRALCLITWAIDPTVDVLGRRRASPLGQSEFEEKLMAYDKRLDELDDTTVRELIGDANLVEDDGLIVVDVLAEDGTWNVVHSLELEKRVAGIDHFSHIVGARQNPRTRQADKQAVGKPEEPAESTKEALPSGPPIAVRTVGGKLLLVFPKERFDLDVAAAFGKGDWDAVLALAPQIAGREKDLVYEGGADFIAPVEFLSEVFVDGKPLSKAEFEKSASLGENGLRTLEVHFPRFGPVLLLAKPDGSRFVSSRKDQTEDLIAALP